jgi:hypothetical protein
MIVLLVDRVEYSLTMGSFVISVARCLRLTTSEARRHSYWASYPAFSPPAALLFLDVPLEVTSSKNRLA